jgi:DNA-binding MarR family transcriptional regulator
MSSKPLPFDPIEEARRQWISRFGDDPAPSMAAVTSIMRVQQILLARLNELLRPYGLTFPRYEALVLLFFSKRGALPLGKMGERLQVHRTSITNIVDQLEADGLIQRTKHAHDRRTTLAEITASGRQLAQAATYALNDAAFAIDALSDTELETVTETLATVRSQAGDFTN